jgi:hypothetical protein
MLARVALSFAIMSTTTGVSFLSMDDMFGGGGRLSCVYGRMNVSFLAITRAAYSANDMVSLPQVLLETGGAGVTDSRDRMYALETLDPLYQVPVLKPDYTISPRQLYTKVATYILASGSFSLFGLAGLAHAPSTVPPSWVPDFTTLPKMSIMLTFIGNRVSCISTSSSSLKPHLFFIRSPDLSNMPLCVVVGASRGLGVSLCLAEKSEELTKKSTNGCVNSAVVEITRLLVLLDPNYC